MTRYSLKDRELQRKLDDISCGDFSKAIAGLSRKPFCAFDVEFGDLLGPERKFMVRFYPEEIEAVPVYDPKRWNAYPDVEPPSDTTMRVAYRHRYDHVERRSCWVFKQGRWYCSTQGDGELDEPVDLDDKVEIRFAPWEDDDE